MILIYKMAEAICIALGDDPHREGETPILYVDAAIAALNAIREPSNKMIGAGQRSGGHAAEYSWNAVVCPPYRSWQAMVDAAIKESRR